MGKRKGEKKDGKKPKARAKDKAAGSSKSAAGTAAGEARKVADKGPGKTPVATNKPASAAESTARRTPVARKATGATARVSAELRRQIIADLAYFLAEQRRTGKDDGVDDWLQAEKAVDRVLAALG